MIDKSDSINQKILVELNGIKAIWDVLYQNNGVSKATYDHNCDLIKERQDELRKELE